MTLIATTPPARCALVVDDVMINRQLAVAYLKRMGWSTSEADSGMAALRWLSNQPPLDLILLDISMPGLDGEEVCRQVRADQAWNTLQIVAYTAHAAKPDIDRFLTNGFNAVLTKPVSLQRMTEVVSSLCPTQNR